MTTQLHIFDSLHPVFFVLWVFVVFAIVAALTLSRTKSVLGEAGTIHLETF